MCKLLVKSGRVQCPRQGDIDVERCANCPDLRSVRLDAAGPVIECESRRSWLDGWAKLSAGEAGFVWTGRR